MTSTVSGAFALLAVMLVIVTSISGLSTYQSKAYVVDQANGFVDLAAASNNMSEVLKDLNQTLAILAPFHGNPTLRYPTAHTNIDLIKEQLNATIADGMKVVRESPTNYSYQQALKNIQSDLTTTLSGELTDTSGSYMWWDWGFYALFAVIATVIFGVFAWLWRKD